MVACLDRAQAARGAGAVPAHGRLHDRRRWPSTRPWGSGGPPPSTSTSRRPAAPAPVAILAYRLDLPHDTT
jgi:hypothetical protein